MQLCFVWQVRAPTPDRIMAPEEAVGHSGCSSSCLSSSRLLNANTKMLRPEAERHEKSPDEAGCLEGSRGLGCCVFVHAPTPTPSNNCYYTFKSLADHSPAFAEGRWPLPLSRVQGLCAETGAPWILGSGTCLPNPQIPQVPY